MFKMMGSQKKNRRGMEDGVEGGEGWQGEGWDGRANEGMVQMHNLKPFSHHIAQRARSLPHDN